MSKKERLEDLGILFEKLKALSDRDIFRYTESKHSYEDWKKLNYDLVEYGDMRGLDYIFRTVRGIVYDLDQCIAIAGGFSDDQ